MWWSYDCEDVFFSFSAVVKNPPNNLWIIAAVLAPIAVVTLIIIIITAVLCRKNKNDFKADAIGNLSPRAKVFIFLSMYLFVYVLIFIPALFLTNSNFPICCFSFFMHRCSPTGADWNNALSIFSPSVEIEYMQCAFSNSKFTFIF